MPIKTDTSIAENAYAVTEQEERTDSCVNSEVTSEESSCDEQPGVQAVSLVVDPSASLSTDAFARKKSDNAFVNLSKLERDEFSSASLRSRADQISKVIESTSEQIDIKAVLAQIEKDLQQQVVNKDLESSRRGKQEFYYHTKVQKRFSNKRKKIFFNEIPHSLVITHLDSTFSSNELYETIIKTEEAWKTCLDKCHELIEQSQETSYPSGERVVCVEVIRLKPSHIFQKRKHRIYFIERKNLTPSALEAISHSFGEHNGVRISESFLKLEKLANVGIVGSNDYTEKVKNSNSCFVVDEDANILASGNAF